MWTIHQLHPLEAVETFKRSKMKVAVSLCCLALIVAHIQAQVPPPVTKTADNTKATQDALIKLLTGGLIPGNNLADPNLIGPGGLGPGLGGPGLVGPGFFGSDFPFFRNLDALPGLNAGLGPNPIGFPFTGPPATYDFRTMAIYNILSNYINGAPAPGVIPTRANPIPANPIPAGKKPAGKTIRR